VEKQKERERRQRRWVARHGALERKRERWRRRWAARHGAPREKEREAAVATTQQN
jgi:hypothetical protein